MSAKCKKCGTRIFDEDAQCYGEQQADGTWVCDECSPASDPLTPARVADLAAGAGTVTEATEIFTLSPEAQIANVLRSLDSMVTGPAHRYRMDAIRSTVNQLNDMWRAYQVGELEPITTGELPF